MSEEPIDGGPPPAQLYALGLVQLMDRTNTHHFVVEVDKLDTEASRGLSINVECDPETRTITFSTGKCQCPRCLAAMGNA